MKAVNLIPSEERRNTSVAGRSGGGAYVVLGVLLVLVVLAATYAVANRSIGEKRAQLADTQVEAQRVQAQAARLQIYQRFTDLRAKRTETVGSIARSRFDWARALREVSRTLPAGVSLSGMSGNVTPGVSAEGAISDPMRAALPNPALVLQGCADGQSGVAATMSALRRIEGVERVTLSSSSKSNGGTGECTGGRTDRPAFSLTVFFSVPASALPAPGTPGASTTATTSTTSTGASK